MIDWYRTGSSQERRAFWSAFCGWGLDTFDIQVYFFILPVLFGALNLSKADAGMIGSVSLISSAIGGWIGGILADRYGRVRALMGTIIWFTAFGVIAGFAQSYEQLLLVRTLQGIGFGGEWAVGATLMAEVINPAHRGKALGLVQSAYSFGLAMAAIVTTAILACFPAELAWRVAFWSGVIPGALVLLIVWKVAEPDIYRRAQQTVKAGDTASILSAFRPGVRRSTILGSLFMAGVQGGGYPILAWMPTLLVQVRHLPQSQVMAATVVVSLGGFCGFLTSAYLCDRFGRRSCLIGFCAAALVTTAIYTLCPVDLWLIVALGFPIGFTVNGLFAAIGPFLSELFPTEIRATCMGFCYNFGKAVGAPTVTLVGVIAAHMELGPSISMFCIGGYLLAMASLWALPETRGRRLDAILPARGAAAESKVTV
jgi:MFS family permease